MITLEKLQREAEADGRRPVVGALILDERGRVYVQRRGPDRAFLPNGWDLVGGHVEAGESLLEALRREVHEETGWAVVGEPQLVFVGDWWTDPDDPSTARREFDFLVDVEGDLLRPALERPKHTESRWIGPAEVGLLDENAGRDDGLVRHLAELALRSAVTERPRFPHATIFLDADVAEPIEELRRRWDPALESQISAHVSVAYPSEAGSIDDLVERMQSAATTVGRFELVLDSPVHRAGQHWWVGMEIVDPDDGWRRLRDLLVPPARQDAGVEPHVTVVHPRHSNLGEHAWQTIADLKIGARFAVTEIAVTAFDGRRWRKLERVSL
jgi:8-oxo-dGTP diphosphatase